MRRGYTPKYDGDIDRIEDGARAQIVEEAVVKAVHSEAVRVRLEEGLDEDDARMRLFSDKSQISYRFLRQIESFVDGLEVAKNEIWEWQEAILDGHKLYRRLREARQGTVVVNLKSRAIEFDKRVVFDGNEPIVNTTFAVGPKATFSKSLSVEGRLATEKSAIISVLGLSDDHTIDEDLIDIDYTESHGMSVQTSGAVQARMWEHSILGFRSTWSRIGSRWVCLMMSVGRPA